jgi:hypothetical protein
MSKIFFAGFAMAAIMTMVSVPTAWAGLSLGNGINLGNGLSLGNGINLGNGTSQGILPSTALIAVELPH